jgi:putative endonuclease
MPDDRLVLGVKAGGPRSVAADLLPPDSANGAALSTVPFGADLDYSRAAMPDERQILGADGERAAEKFLRRQRYAILARNYRCRSGEVDLIALDGTTVVFIEVKTRTQLGFGSPLEAVDRRKQHQIQRAALQYLTENRLHDRNARFDVVGVWWDNGRVQCELVKNAFEVS